jgi:PAT family beta-lactamase induction signal transducer AmpG
MNKHNPWGWVPTLYFAEALPFVAVSLISVVMYKRLGMDNADITFYTSWLNLPWVIKPFWSPFVDIIKTKRWWVLAMELFIGAALGGVAFTIPTDFWVQSTLCFFMLMAFCSATHDIAADGYYMLELTPHAQTFFVGIRSTFYRIATVVGQGVLVMIAGNLETLTRKISYSWSLTFYLLTGVFIAIWLYHCFRLPVAKDDKPTSNASFRLVMSDFGKTFKTFFTKDNMWVAILFMLFYRMPEGLLVKIEPLFLIDSTHNGGLGLSTQELGLVQGTVGVIGLVIGGIIGGILASRGGLKRWLWPMVCAITIPDIVYVYLSYVQPDNLWIINICVGLEQFGYGFGFTAYMLYLIYYSQGEHKTAHYAICTGFMSLSLMIPGLFAGALQESIGYQSFFIIVMLACIATFIVARMVKIDPEFGKVHHSDE